MKNIQEVMAAKAGRITHLLTDVDGVHTSREAGVSICELLLKDIPYGFTEVNGDIIRPLIPCDVFGVPEKDGLVYISGKAGNPVFEVYRFYTPDGQAIIDLLSHRIAVWFISGRNSPCVRVRAAALGAQAALGIREKHSWLSKQEWFAPESTLFVSDNAVDAPLLKVIRDAGGIAIAPADAQPEALAAAECVTNASGGKGVIAEIIKALLSARKVQ